MGEVALAALLCSFLAGSAVEERQYFGANGIKRYVRVDCETATHVIEIGLDDTDSARDSIHQALFAAHLADGKTPVVILIDRDSFEGRFEFEMRHVAKAARVTYLRCTEAWIHRWAATRGFRVVDGGDDLPADGTARTLCDLDALAGPDVTGIMSVSGSQASEEH